MHSGERDTHLGGLVEAVVGRLRPRADAAGLTLGHTVAARVAPRRPIDPARLQQVLTSLVGSALDAADREVTVAVDTGDGGVLRFEVGGTPADAWDGRASSRLAVCRRLVGAMGGELGVRELPRGTSVVWFTARLEPVAADGRPLAAPERPAARGEGQGRPRVLVADDSPVNREVARRTLARMGYEVGLAADGAAAVEAVATGAFAAVLMDCQMPGMDGYEATAAIRRREAEGGRGRTPVIAMTASASQADREGCLAAGMDDHISKPFEYAALEAVLARWVARAP
jgi:CheY-like chemotaxis protein